MTKAERDELNAGNKRFYEQPIRPVHVCHIPGNTKPCPACPKALDGYPDDFQGVPY